MKEILCTKCNKPAAFPKAVKEPYTCIECQEPENSEALASEGLELRITRIDFGISGTQNNPQYSFIWPADLIRDHGTVDHTAEELLFLAAVAKKFREFAKLCLKETNSQKPQP